MNVFNFANHKKEQSKPVAVVVPVVKEPKVLGPKAIDELREILGKDENVRDFFLFLKDKQLRAQAIEKLNQAIGK